MRNIQSEKDKESFILAVYDIVRAIPEGRVTSYGAIAKATGFANLSRMVGKILSNCGSEPNNIPAHRVVNSQGKLTGRSAFGSSDEMQSLLKAEGIEIRNDKVQNWKKAFWNPLTEIQLLQ